MKYDREKAYRYLTEYQQYMNKVKDNRRPEGFYENLLDMDTAKQARNLIDIFSKSMPQYDTIEFYMLLIVYEAALSKAASKLFKGDVDFPEYGLADTKEFNAYLITPNNEKDASFIVFNEIQHRFVSSVSRLVAKILIEIDYFQNKSNILQRLENFLNSDLSINEQYIKTMMTFFYPEAIKYERNISIYKKINISAITCGHSMMFSFSHEYSHFILEHEYQPINDIMLNQIIYSSNKRKNNDELFCDICAIKLMTENLNNDDKEVIDIYDLMLISIYQLFFVMQKIEKYKNNKDETHPPIDIRIKNLKTFFNENSFYKKSNENIFNIIKTIFMILDANNRKLIGILLDVFSINHRIMPE